MIRDFDEIDRRILDVLQADGRISIVELANRVHLTSTPCTERVKRLERLGVISGYHAVLDPEKIGLPHVTIIQISLKQTESSLVEDFNKAVMLIPEIQCCLMLVGQFDYLLKVRTRDIQHFRELLGDKISKLPGLMQTQSYTVMETVKDTDAIRMVGQNKGNG